MSNMRKWAFRCVAVVLLSSVNPVQATPGFTDNFDSYTLGSPLPSPWVSFDTRNNPTETQTRAGFITVAGIGAGGDSQYAAPVNPYVSQLYRPVDFLFDAPNRQVDITYYWKFTGDGNLITATDPNMTTARDAYRAANLPMSFYNVVQEGFSPEQPGKVTWNPSYPTQLYMASGMAGFPVTPLNSLHLDGSWNKIEVVMTASSTNALRGESQLYLNDVAMPGTQWWQIGNGATAPSQVGIMISRQGQDPNTKAANWAIDNVSVRQDGFAAAPPAPCSVYPSTKYGGGGIVSDGQRYVYVLAASHNTGDDPNHPVLGPSELWRYDSQSRSWARLQDAPSVNNGAGGYLGMARGLALTTDGVSTRLTTLYPGHLWDPNSDSYFSLPFVNTFTINPDPNVGGVWGTPDHPDESEPGSWDTPGIITGMGTRVYGPEVVMQGGCVIYNPGTGHFSAAQHLPESGSVPGNWVGTDVAYVSAPDLNGVHWMYGLGKRADPNGLQHATIYRFSADQNPTEVFASYSWDRPGSQLWHSDMLDSDGNAVLYPNPNGVLPWLSLDDTSLEHAMAYVPEGISSVFIFHSDPWGNAGLYEIPVEGGGLIVALGGTRNLYRFDPDTGGWTTYENVLPFEYGTFTGYDDMTAGFVPEPATLTLVGLGGLALVRRRRKHASAHNAEAWYRAAR